ncbi:universal stress protein, partial [Actinocorallia lasiicapitis]
IVAVGDHPVAAVLDAAVREAELRGSPLRIAHSWWEPPVESFGAPAPLPPLDPTPVIEALRERLDGELAPWLDGPGASLTIVQGHPRELLTGLSAGASLLVTGRHEHPGRHLRALGSVAHSVVHHAACPVMVVGS